MADVKLVVIYPRPKDVDVFERVYREEHVPLAVGNWVGRPRSSQPRYSPHRKVPLPSTGWQKFIFLRSKPWKHARRQKAAKRRSLTQ
jgi:hypothetical protein